VKPETPHIILNNQIINSEAIAGQLNNQTLSGWEKELYLFLNEWFSDSDFVLAQTSGSTGEPKPIELSKSLMLNSAKRTIDYFNLKKNDRLLLSLPCRYIAGKMMAVRAIVGQMNLVTVDPAGDFDILENETFDFGAMVPNQIVKILAQPSGKEKLQNIQNLLIGGSAISAELEMQISKLSSQVVSTYGMTETASHIAIQELSVQNKSGFYRCLSGISVGLNENRCLQIHHPEFQEPIHTNDLAEVLSPTRFKILGRADSVIVSGGIKYFPEMLEKKLEPYFDRRFVISSVPDTKLGEMLVIAFEGGAFEIKISDNRFGNIQNPFERPKSIFFLTQFPETLSGKIIRSEIKHFLGEESGHQTT
jgi:O-succinylbenzoic acid--CoA ligase